LLPKIAASLNHWPVTRSWQQLAMDTNKLFTNFCVRHKQSIMQQQWSGVKNVHSNDFETRGVKKKSGKVANYGSSHESFN